MRDVRAATLAVIAGIALVPTASRGQQPESPRPAGIVRTFLEGLMAGGALGASYITPYGEGWVVADEAALPLSAATGVTAAFVARALSLELEPDAARRPRLRMALGRSSETGMDYSMALRVPVSRMFEAEASVVTASDTWERRETQTRCNFFVGCITADYITDSRYEQSVALLVGGAFSPAPRSRLNPTLAIGVGPVATNVELHETGRFRTSGLVSDAMLGLDYGRRSRWTVEAGARMISGGDAEGTSLQVRVGRAFGF